MQPLDPDTAAARDAQAWAAFVGSLALHLAGEWPEMPAKLGERYGAFVEHTAQHAVQRGFAQAASIARVVNLSFVWGPGFVDKPGFEWAAGILAAPHAEAVLVHQLVRRSLVELAGRANVRIEPVQLDGADARVHERFGMLGRHGSADEAPLPQPRRACDLEAAELRVAVAWPTHEYRPDGDGWERVLLAPLPPLRIDAARPLPPLIALLSQAPGAGEPARLQWRIRMHAVCDGERHPLAEFGGSQGLWRWAGHETRAFGWPVAALANPPSPAGVVAEETSPEIGKLRLETCGLRDEGDPLGALETLVYAYPAEQWWCEVQRAQPQPQAVEPARPWTRAVTRCRLERDGRAADAAALVAAFDDGLEAAVGRAAERLLAAWSALAGLSAPRLDATLGMLVGRAALTWGWRAGPGGLDGRALLRVVGRLAMQACVVDLALEGELALSGTRSRVRLSVRGRAALPEAVDREAGEPLLLQAMQPLRVPFRLPFELQVDPIADETGATCGLAGAVGGALAGEAGLRPRLAGGSGYEWYARLAVEPVGATFAVHDPLQGGCMQSVVLLPSVSLLDWSSS